MPSIPRFWMLLLGIVAGLVNIEHQALAEPGVHGLFVAIDEYNSFDCGDKVADSIGLRRSIPDLRGAENDALQFLEAVRHRMGQGDLHLQKLHNKEATRAAILSGIRNQLIEPAKAGDIVIFYYSGHGSQVRNSLSREADKLDETIVPVDTLCGAYDIRDKELATLFQEIIDKGAWLYAFFDSCHSGSIARGPAEFQVRLAPPNQGRDVADGKSYPVPESTDRAAIFSAAHHYQVAAEMEIDGQWRGLFTHALEQALLSDGLSGTSLNDFAKRVRALMESQSRVRQFPTLQATHSMLQYPIFSPGQSASREPVSFVLSAIDRDKQLVAIPAGRRDGLSLGARLVTSDPSLQSIGNGLPRVDHDLEVEITDAALSRATARVVSGSLEEVSPGTPMYISRWGVDAISVWLEPRYPPAVELEALTQLISSLAGMQIWDGSESTRRVYWRDRSWWYEDESATVTPWIWSDLDSTSLASHSPMIHLHMPPPEELAAPLRETFRRSSSVALAPDRERAHFELQFSVRPSCDCPKSRSRPGVSPAGAVLDARHRDQESGLGAWHWHWRWLSQPANIYWGDQEWGTDWIDTSASNLAWFASETSVNPTHAGIVELVDGLAKWYRFKGIHAPFSTSVLPYRTEIRRGGSKDASESVDPDALRVGEEYSIWMVLDETRLPGACVLVSNVANIYLLNLTDHGQVTMFFPRKYKDSRPEDENPVQLKVSLDDLDRDTGQVASGMCRLKRQIWLAGFQYGCLETNRETFLLLSTDTPVRFPERQLTTHHKPRTSCGCQSILPVATRGPGIDERWTAEHIEVTWQGDAPLD